MKKASKTKTRITIDLSEKGLLRLEQLVIRVGATSKVAVIRQALQLYEWMLEEVSEGNKSIFISEEESIPNADKIKIFWG